MYVLIDKFAVTCRQAVMQLLADSQSSTNFDVEFIMGRHIPSKFLPIFPWNVMGQRLHGSFGGNFHAVPFRRSSLELHETPPLRTENGLELLPAGVLQTYQCP